MKVSEEYRIPDGMVGNLWPDYENSSKITLTNSAKLHLARQIDKLLKDSGPLETRHWMRFYRYCVRNGDFLNTIYSDKDMEFNS